MASVMCDAKSQKTIKQYMLDDLENIIAIKIKKSDTTSDKIDVLDPGSENKEIKISEDETEACSKKEENESLDLYVEHLNCKLYNLEKGAVIARNNNNKDIKKIEDIHLKLEDMNHPDIMKIQ